MGLMEYCHYEVDLIIHFFSTRRMKQALSPAGEIATALEFRKWI